MTDVFGLFPFTCVLLLPFLRPLVFSPFNEESQPNAILSKTSPWFLVTDMGTHNDNEEW